MPDNKVMQVFISGVLIGGAIMLAMAFVSGISWDSGYQFALRQQHMTVTKEQP